MAGAKTSSIGRYRSGVSELWTGTFEDDASPAIGIDKARFNTLTLKVYDPSDNHYFIGTANAGVDVKIANAHGFTLNTSGGGFSWQIPAGFLTPQDPEASVVEHIARLDWTYDSVKVGIHERRLRIVNFLPLCLFEDVAEYREGIDESHRLLVESMIDSLSARIASEYNRELRLKDRTEVVRVFDEYTYYLNLKGLPIRSITSIKEGGESPDLNGWASVSAMDASEYTLSAKGLRVKSMLRPFQRGYVQVVYSGGYAREAGSVPMHVRQAVAQQVAFNHQNKNRIGQVSQSVQGAGSITVTKLERDLLPNVEAVLDKEFRLVGI